MVLYLHSVSLPTLKLRPYRIEEFERACEIRELINPETRERMKRNIESSGTWGDHFLHLAIDQAGVLVGDIQLRHCQFSMPPGVAEIGVEVAKELRGQGIGSQSLELASQYLFETGYYRVAGSTAVTNIAMQKAFEKAGWIREGVFHNLFVEAGIGIDYIVYAITHLGGGAVQVCVGKETQ